MKKLDGVERQLTRVTVGAVRTLSQGEYTDVGLDEVITELITLRDKFASENFIELEIERRFEYDSSYWYVSGLRPETDKEMWRRVNDQRNLDTQAKLRRQRQYEELKAEFEA